MINSYDNRILIKLVEPEKKNKYTLLLPDEKKEFQIGKVVSVGKEISTVAEGAFVYTRKFAGLLLEFDGEEYISLDSKEILAYSKELK